MPTMGDVLEKFPNLVQVQDVDGCLGIIDRRYNQRTRYFNGLGNRPSIIVGGEIIPALLGVAGKPKTNFYFFNEDNSGLLHFKMHWENTKLVKYSTYAEYVEYLHCSVGHKLT